ncbi:MAG: hypothetical protein ACK5N8_04500 [Alphaproteobacteria bacterium]
MKLILIFSLFVSAFNAVDLDDYFETKKESIILSLFGYHDEESNEHEVDASLSTVGMVLNIYIPATTYEYVIKDFSSHTYDSNISEDILYSFSLNRNQFRPPIS